MIGTREDNVNGTGGKYDILTDIKSVRLYTQENMKILQMSLVFL